LKQNKFIAYFLLLLNVMYFFWATVTIIITEGGAMGFGYLFLPITLSINLLTIPAIMKIKTPENSYSCIINWVNGIGVIWTLFWVTFMIM